MTGPGEATLLRAPDGTSRAQALSPHAHALLFARLLLAGAPADAWLHVWRARRAPDGRLIAQRRDVEAWAPAGRPDAIVAKAMRWRDAGLEVFAGVLPRARRETGRDAVTAGAILWVDADNPEALRRLAAFCQRRPPHYLAASGGGGRHAAWRLDRAHDPTELERACRRLAGAVGGDRAVCHRGASLRLPGTRNGKPGASWCRVLEADLAHRSYPLERLTADLPEAPQAARRNSSGSSSGAWLRAARGDDELARVAPPAYFQLLAGVETPDGGGLVSCPLPGHADRRPSCMVYATAERGWRCFSHPGGPVGGRLYDLASALNGGPTGYALRGPAFLAARDVARAALRAAGAPRELARGQLAVTGEGGRRAA